MFFGSIASDFMFQCSYIRFLHVLYALCGYVRPACPPPARPGRRAARGEPELQARRPAPALELRESCCRAQRVLVSSLFTSMILEMCLLDSFLRRWSKLLCISFTSMILEMCLLDPCASAGTRSGVVSKSLFSEMCLLDCCSYGLRRDKEHVAGEAHCQLRYGRRSYVPGACSAILILLGESLLKSITEIIKIE